MFSVGCSLTDNTLTAFVGEHVMQMRMLLLLQSQCMAAVLWKDVLGSANTYVSTMTFPETEMVSTHYAGGQRLSLHAPNSQGDCKPYQLLTFDYSRRPSICCSRRKRKRTLSSRQHKPLQPKGARHLSLPCCSCARPQA